MEPIYMEYTISPRDYRAMTYFNSFSIKRLQAAFVVVAWVAAATLLLLEWLVELPITRIMHLCFLVVTVALPVLVLNLEYSIHRFRSDHCGKDAVRRIVVFNDDGVRHSTAQGTESLVDTWGTLLRIFELREVFVLYKDARRTVIIPKSGLTEQKLDTLRQVMQAKMGKLFVTRN